MTAYFNATLFKRNLIRFWPLAAVAFLAALLFFIIPEVASSRGIPSTVYIDSSGAEIVTFEVKDIMQVLAVFCAVVVFPLSIFTAIAVFGYLHNPKAAGFVSSLPITRTGLYITNWVSGLTILLAPALLAGALYGLLLIGLPVPSGDFLRWIGALIASYLIFFSVAVFFTFLSGNPIIQAFLYAAFNFVCMIFYWIVKILMEMFVFGSSAVAYSPVYDFIIWLTPPVAIVRMIELMAPFRVWHSVFDNGTNTLYTIIPWLMYLLFSAFMILAGWLLYRRRYIEVAGEVLAHRSVKSVFKYTVGFFSGVLFGLILIFAVIGRYTSSLSTLTVWFTISMIFFGTLGCLFAEMLIQKRFRVFKAAYKGIIVFVFSIVAVALFIRADGTGYERHVPDQNDVVSVSVTAPHMFYTSIHGLGDRFTTRQAGINWHLTQSYRQEQQRLGLPLFNDEILNEIKLRTPVYFESPEAITAAIKLHRTIVDHKSFLIDLMDDIKTAFHFYQTYTITYTMKNGSLLTREYTLPINPYYTPPITYNSALPINHVDDNLFVGLLLDLYNHTEAVNKRNRFVDLPDSSVHVAVLTPVIEDDWLTYVHFSSRIGYSHNVFLTDNLNNILEAFREDSANGTLGRLRRVDLVPPNSFINDDIATIGVIDLLLDFRTAGVPTAFEPDMFINEDGFIVSGLVVSIIINETHVNTVRVLEELGLLTG